MIYKMTGIEISGQLLAAAKAIQHENHDKNCPSKLNKTSLNDVAQLWQRELKNQLTKSFCEHHKATGMDSVLFSCPEGAKLHVDDLDPDQFETSTILTPVILPDSPAIFSVHIGTDHLGEEIYQGTTMTIGHSYVFNHTQKHQLTIKETPANCVLVMTAMKKVCHH